MKVSTPVEHHQRQIEFHDLLFEAQGLFGQATDWDSCETMAFNLARRLSQLHQGAPFRVSVFEDGEAGATVNVT